MALNSDTDKSSQLSSESGIDERNIEVDYSKVPKSWKDLHEDALADTVKSLKERRTSIHEMIIEDVPEAKVCNSLV